MVNDLPPNLTTCQKEKNMGVELLPQKIRDNYEVHEWKHACAILANDFPEEWKDIIELLEQFKLCKSWINVGGVRKEDC